MIDLQTRSQIKGYLEGFIQGLLEQHRPEATRAMVREARATYVSPKGMLKPFHEAIVPPEIMRISAFERSFSTKLGTTFEECARFIASRTHVIAERGYTATGRMPAAAAAKIEEIVSRISEGHAPHFPSLVAQVLEMEGDELVERPAVADLYLVDRAGHEFFFEIKFPKPNKGQCLEVTERLLRVHAIRGKDRPHVSAFYAMAYNPYGARVEDYRHRFALQYLDMENQVLLGAQFWTLVGGEGTYEELLDIYAEVGREKGKAMIDTLAFGA
ncbi:MAG: TdeIII family type II restriction endonuclease [Anaerolineae bacterium]